MCGVARCRVANAGAPWRSRLWSRLQSCTMRITVWGCVGLLVLVGAAGCASKEKAKPTAKPKPVPSVTIASVGADEWPAGKAAISRPKRQKTPDGYSDAEVSALVSMLVTSARTAVTDPTVFHSDAPIPLVLKPIPAPTSSRLSTSFRQLVIPNIAAGTVFGSEVEVVGEPRIKSRWKIKTKKVAGEKLDALSVELSTYAVYEVSGTTRGNRVIGVSRALELTSWGQRDSQPGNYGFTWTVRLVGVHRCELAVQDHLTPGADFKQNAKSLTNYVKSDGIKTDGEPDPPTIDLAFKKKCLAEAEETKTPAAG